MTFNMEPPIFIHGVLLLLVTTQYPPRNNDVTSHLTQIQPLKAVNYALQCKNPQKLMFLENMTMDSQQILFQQKPLCQSIKIPWKKQGVTMHFKKLFNISCRMLKNVSLYVNSASNWPTSVQSDTAASAFWAKGRGFKSTHGCSHTVQKSSISPRLFGQCTLLYILTIKQR